MNTEQQPGIPLDRLAWPTNSPSTISVSRFLCFSVSPFLCLKDIPIPGRKENHGNVAKTGLCFKQLLIIYRVLPHTAKRDLGCEEKRIIAEVKNKYNTVKGDNLSDLYNTLHEQVMKKSSRYKGFTAYYVTIIPKRAVRFIKPFTPSDKSIGSRKPENNKILQIDGASFYDLVTDSENSLLSLFNVLPFVVEEIIANTIIVSESKKLDKYYEDAFGNH